MPVATPPSAAEAAILGPATKIIRRCEILNSDGSIWLDDTDSIRIIDGQVPVSYGRDVRRSLDLTLDNTDGWLKQNPYGGFWYDKIIRVYRGVSYSGLTWEAPLGEFMIDRIDNSNFPHTVKVTGRDYVKKMSGSKFGLAVTFAAGKFIEDLIASIAANAGITKRILAVTGQRTGKDFTFDAGTTRWDACSQIADAYGYELFFDAQGYLVMREYQDPVSAAIAYTLQTGRLGNLVSYQKSTNDTQLYNHVAVTGESSDSTVTPVCAEAINDNPGSPTNIARLGDRLYRYTSSFITTKEQAQDVAAKFLKIHALEQYEISFSSIVLPWLEVGSIVEFLDPDRDVNDPTRFLLTDLSIPLGLGAMSGTAKRVTPVTDSGVQYASQIGPVDGRTKITVWGSPAESQATAWGPT